MVNPDPNFDPELLQARWILRGLKPEELVEQALIALDQGFTGAALQQLAGLSQALSRDLGKLPEGAFAELGLGPIDPDQAVSRLISRGEPKTAPTVSKLREAFPKFSDRWRKYVAGCGGVSAGPYIDISEFVTFVMEDLYEHGDLAEVRRFFQLLEKLLVEAPQAGKDLIGWGFFETLQCVASHRGYGNKVFEEFLGPMSQQIWREIQRAWSGQSSLADVIRAERKPKQSPET